MAIKMWLILFGIISNLASAQCDPECLVCGADGNCETCPSPQFPSGPSCVECEVDPIECSVCSEHGGWSCKCRDPESVNNCGECPGDCNHCDPTIDAVCLVCPLGQFVNSEGVCQDCASPCYACSDLETCHSCQRGLVLVNNFCCSWGCKNCDINECYECDDGLTLTDGYCVREPCPSNSYYDGSSCVSCEKGCLRCDSLGCIECETGFSLSDGLCVNCEQAGCVGCQRGCEKCEDTGKCTTCLAGWDLFDPYPKCLPKWCFEGCVKQAANNGLCLECAPGYQLIYYVAHDQGCCFKKCPHDNCLTHWFGTCLTCPVGYYLYNHCCAPKCPDNSHCQKYDKYMWCTLCDKGYYLSKSGCCVKLCCKKSQQACSSIDIFGNCQSCIDGWTLNNGCCLPKCEENCLVFYSTPFGATCFKCIDGYEPLPFPNGCCKPKCCKRSVLHTFYVNGLATGCFQGWHFDSHHCCIPDCPNDHQVSVLFNSIPPEWCFGCEKGYYQLENGCCAPNCCEQSQAYCTGYSQGWCTGCKTGWVLGPLGCCMPKCLKDHVIDYLTADGTVCFKCDAGYYQLTSNFCCAPKCCKLSEAQCLQIGIDGYCKSCKQGYMIDPNTGCCVPKCPTATNFIEIFYDLDNDEYCYRCKKGYKPLPNGCCTKACDPLSDAHCVAVNLLNICVKCAPGWTLVDGCCFPKCPNGHCLTIENGFCKECETGYFLSPDTYCCVAACKQESIANCLLMGPDGWCQKCKPKWTPDEFGCCIPICPREHCEIYQDGWCARCEPGYQLINYCCAPTCDRGHCLKMGLDGWCVQCEKGFYINSIGCCEPKCPEGHCVEEGLDGWCIRCETGYYLHSSFCCAPYCEKNYCAVARWDGFCIRCLKGYALNDEGCCIPLCPNGHCASFTSAGWCERCEENYSLNNFGCCIPNCREDKCAKVGLDGWCLACIKGYNLNPFGCCVKLCKQDLCVQWGFDGLCDQCLDGYQLQPDRCCAPVCPKGNCATMGTNGWCIKCITGYSINDKGCCQPKCDLPWLCEDADGNGYCLRCPEGYYNHKSGCCAPICNDANCSVMRFDGWCSKCNPGFSIINGCCVAP